MKLDTLVSKTSLQSDSLIFRAANRPTLESIELPAPGPLDALVEIHCSGVSVGTETSVISGTRTHNGTFPLVSGYMSSGIISKIGSGVTDLQPGDRVTSWGTRIQGDVTPVWGAHSAWHVCEAASLQKIPDGCDLRSAAMWILPRVGLNAVRMAEITEQDMVLISGQGLIGQFFGQWAAARGARLILIEPDPLRARLAAKYVEAPVLNPLSCDLAEEVERLTDGQWPTVLVEATANPKLISQTTSLIRRMHSRLVFLSWYPSQITVDFAHLHNWEATALFPSGAGDAETGRAVLDGFARGTIQLGENLTDCVPWTEAPEAFRRICEGDRTIGGMVIDWTAGR